MARKPDWMCGACWSAEGKTCPHRGTECTCGPSYNCRDCKQPSKARRKTPKKKNK